MKNGGKCFLVGTITPCTKPPIDFENEWIVDSGCEHHVTGDQSKFSKICDYEGNYSIIIADNTVHFVQKEGTIWIDHDDDEQTMLTNVFHVPGKKKNMFFVSDAVDVRHLVLFGPEDVKFLKNVESIKADVVHYGNVTP